MNDTTKTPTTKKTRKKKKKGLQKKRRDGKMQQGIDYIVYQTLSGAKSVRIDRHLRLCEIDPLLSRGVPTTIIVQTIQKDFGVSATQIHDDIRLLIAQWQSENNQLLPVKALQVERALWDVVKHAMDESQYGAATGALRLISDIHGLRQPEQIAMLAISTDNEASSEMSVNEVAGAARRILAKTERLRRAEKRQVIDLADDQFVEEDVTS